MPDHHPLGGPQPSELAVTLYGVTVSVAELRCQMCRVALPTGGRKDKRYCSDSCRQRRYYRNRKLADIGLNVYAGRRQLYTVTHMMAQRLPEPVLPAHLALAIRREFRVAFHVEWLPKLCARLGCGMPVSPNDRSDRAFCSNACRQRAHRHARRGALQAGIDPKSRTTTAPDPSANFAAGG